MAELSRTAAKATETAAGKTALKNGSKFVPGLGTVIGVGMVASDLKKGHVASAVNDGIGMMGLPGAIVSTGVSLTGLDKKADKALSPSSIKESKYPGSSKLNKEAIKEKHAGKGPLETVKKMMENYKKLGKWGAIPGMALGAMLFSALSTTIKGISNDKAKSSSTSKDNGPELG